MRPITDILREIRRGRGVDLATDMLAEVVRAVGETGKAGSLTIKISVKPDETGGNQKNLAMTCTSSVPRPSVPDAIFFSDESGDLHRSDPDQREMFGEAEGRGPRAATG